ncbi:MAG TPA: hypothetical protein VN903_28715 [Polyangia bacterium]|nr:hypothetical protein [Polyangia bacterium]
MGVSQAPALSGGSWSATLPLTNVQDRRLGRVARSTDATAANTKIIIDLGTARAVGLLAILIPNITKSSTPTVQWKGGTSSGASDVYNPGTQSYWPTGVTLEDVTGVDGSVLNVWSWLIPNAAQTARFWEVDIVDTANADGYLNVARLVICGAYTPTINLAVGAKTGHETETVRTVTPGGAALYNPKPRRRIDVFNINDLSNAESYGTVRKIQRKLGTSGQLFWVPDPSDSTYGFERNYLGVLRDLSPLEMGVGAYLNTSWSITEDL